MARLVVKSGVHFKASEAKEMSSRRKRAQTAFAVRAGTQLSWSKDMFVLIRGAMVVTQVDNFWRFQGILGDQAKSDRISRY